MRIAPYVFRPNQPRTVSAKRAYFESLLRDLFNYKRVGEGSIGGYKPEKFLVGFSEYCAVSLALFDLAGQREKLGFNVLIELVGQEETPLDQFAYCQETMAEDIMKCLALNITAPIIINFSITAVPTKPQVAFMSNFIDTFDKILVSGLIEY